MRYIVSITKDMGHDAHLVDNNIPHEFVGQDEAFRDYQVREPIPDVYDDTGFPIVVCYTFQN